MTLSNRQTPPGTLSDPKFGNLLMKHSSPCGCRISGKHESSHARGGMQMRVILLLLSVYLALLTLPTSGRSAPQSVGTQQVDEKAPSSCPVTIGRKSDI